ncbi:MAG TPA: glycosyltransferase family 4 protein, partial [Acidobacteriota bacterium]|nr:glycosyltransferase family 4 protein [Acidobacteriota bacterium]
INRVSAVHCTADTERDSFARLGLRPPAFVVPNAIDMARFGKLPPRGGLRSRLGIPESAVQLLFLGRLTGIKRPDIAIETMGALRASGHEAHLVMAGPDEGNLTAKLRAQAHGLGCAAQVHFTGLLAGDEVLQALADTDLLIMPSEVQENFGMSALEAMAAGVPVLAAEGVPAGSWASAAGAGIVVPCSNQGFRTAALEALSHPERLRAMGRAGKDLARRRFDRDVVALEMLAQCEAVIATGRPLPGYLGQRSK